MEAPGGGGRSVGPPGLFPLLGKRKLGTMMLQTQFVGRPGTETGIGVGSTDECDKHAMMSIHRSKANRNKTRTGSGAERIQLLLSAGTAFLLTFLFPRAASMLCGW